MIPNKDKIKSFYDDVIAPQKMFSNEDEFRNILKDSKSSKSFYEDVVAPQKMFSSYDEFQNTLGLKKKEPAQPSTGSLESSRFLQEKPTPTTTIPYRPGAKERLDVQKELEPQIKKQKEVIRVTELLQKPLPYQQQNLPDFNLNKPIKNPIELKVNKINNGIELNKLRALEGKKNFLDKRTELDVEMSKLQSLKNDYDKADNDVTREGLSKQYNIALESAKAKEAELSQLKTEIDNTEITAKKLEKGLVAIKSMSDEKNSALVNSMNNFYNNTIPSLAKGIGYTIGAAADLAQMGGAGNLPATTTDSKTAGDYVRQFSDRLTDEMFANVDDEFKNKSIFDKDENGEYSNLKSPTAWANFITATSGQLLTTAIGGGLGGKVVSRATGMFTAMPDIYEGAKEAGLNNQEAALFSIPVALTVGAFEEGGAAPFIIKGAKKAFSKQLGIEMASKVAGKEVTPELIQKVFGEAYQTALDKTTSKFGNIITDALPEAGGEAAEQALQGLAEMGYDATFGKGKERGKGAFGTTFKDVIVQSGEAGVGGFVAATPFSSIKNLSTSQKTEFVNLVKDASNDKEVYNSVIEGLDELKANNEINQGQYNQYVKRFNDMVSLNTKIPPAIDGEARLDAMELVKRKDELVEQKKVVDSSFYEQIDNQISDIDTKLKELATQPAKPVTPPTAEVTLPEVEVAAEKPAPAEPIEAQKVEVKEEPKEIVAKEVVTEAKPVEEVAVTEETKPAEEVIAVEKPITETTYNFEKDKPENAAKFDYYTREVDGITKYFKKEKQVAEEAVTEGEKKKTTKVSDFLRKNLKTKPIVFKDKDGNEIILEKQGFDWDGMVDKVADLIDKGYEVALAVKEYLKSQDWFKSLNKDQQDAIIEKSITDFETSIKEAKKVTETVTETKEVVSETEVEKKDRTTKLKDKINKLREDIKGLKYEQRWKDAEAKLMREYEAEKQKVKGEKELKDLKEKYDIKLGKSKEKLLDLKYEKEMQRLILMEQKENALAKQKKESKEKLNEIKNKYKTKIESLKEQLKEKKYELKYLTAEANTVIAWLKENRKELKGLTDSEYQRLVTKVSGVGLKSDIDEVMDYISKMVENADYSTSLSKSKELHSKLKTLAKSKTTLTNEAESLKKLVSIPPNTSWDIEKINKYNEFADKLIKSVAPSKDSKGKVVNATKDIPTSKIDEEYDKLKKDYDENTLAKLVKDNAWYFEGKQRSIDNLEEYKSDLAMINNPNIAEDRAEEALARLEQKKEFKDAMKDVVSSQIIKVTNLDKDIREEFSKEDNKTIDRLKDIDVELLSTKDLIRMNNVLNNIELNGDFSGVGEIDVIAKAQKELPIIRNIVNEFKTLELKDNSVFNFARKKRSLDAIMQRLTLASKKAEAKLKVAFGDTDLSLNNVKVNKFVNKIKDIIKDYNKKYKPTPKDIHTNGVIAYLIQTNGITEAEKVNQFNELKETFKQSYENLKKSEYKNEKDLGELQEQIYKDLDLDNVKSQQQLIYKYSEMNKPAMDFVLDIVDTYAEIEPLFRKNQERYNNTTYQKTQDYTPIKHRTLKSVKKEDIEGQIEYLRNTMGVNKALSKSSIKRVGMNKANQYIDTDFNRLMYTRANDIANQAYTLADRRYMNYLLNTDEFKDIFGVDTAKILQDAFGAKADHIMNNYPIPDELDSALKPFVAAANLGSVRAIAGATQGIKQMVVLVNTSLDLAQSGNGDLIGKAFQAKRDEAFDKFLDNMPISLRESTDAGTNLSKNIDEITESKIKESYTKTLNKIFEGQEKLGEKVLVPLKKGDTYPAELSWAAYYMESLRNQGENVDNIDWEQENNKLNEGDASRKEAIAYAESKVSSKQNVSDPSNVSEIIGSKRSWVQLGRSLITPLSSYAINTRNRLNDDFLALALGGDRKAAAKDIVATLGEMYVYSVVAQSLYAFLLKPGGEMLLEFFGFDPEKDPREWDEILKDIATQKALWGTAADFLFTGTTVFGEKFGKDALNYFYTALNDKGLDGNDYFNSTPEEIDRDRKEQRDYERTLPFRTQTIPETFGKAGTLGIGINLGVNAFNSLAYITEHADKARMEKAKRLGETRLEGIKTGEYVPSFKSNVELTDNEEMFFLLSGVISAVTLLAPMFSELTSINRMAYEKARRQAEAKYGYAPKKYTYTERIVEKEPTGFYTNVFKLMEDREKIKRGALPSIEQDRLLKEIDEKLKREYMRRAGVNKVTQEQLSKFLIDLDKQRKERISKGFR